MKKEDVKVKKLNNKGFSLVEIIIVIAIMAIMAGALAPQLIKYIDKSRKSTDIQTAQTIATAVNAALADEAGYVSAADTKVSACYGTIADDSLKAFRAAIRDVLGGTRPEPKYKSGTSDDFFVEVNADKTFAIYVGDSLPTTPESKAKLILYPTVGSDYK